MQDVYFLLFVPVQLKKENREHYTKEQRISIVEQYFNNNKSFLSKIVKNAAFRIL